MNNLGIAILQAATLNKNAIKLEDFTETLEDNYTLGFIKFLQDLLNNEVSDAVQLSTKAKKLYQKQ